MDFNDRRKTLPSKDFGLPDKAKTAKAKGESGNYPMPDKSHAKSAKAFAARFASPAEKAKIDAKADKILGEK